jgi:hypothetical protein
MSNPRGVSPPVPIWQRPWSLMLGSIAAAGTGLLLARLDLIALDPLRLILLAAALLLAGIAVLLGLRRAVTDLEDRTEPTCLVALSALVAFVANRALPTEWDSAQMFTTALGIVGLVGACLVALPSIPRKILISLIILFHFGGILTAVSSQQPGEAQPPWLMVQAWGNVYHPYLQFMYMTNAYHFYSPEPGPATLLWFRVQYASGKSRWVKLPSRMLSPVPIHYIRTLAMADTIHNFQQVDPETQTRLTIARRQAEMVYGIPFFTGPEIPISNQYRRPNDFAMLLTSSYARHIALTSPNPDDPADPVESVKVYRVTHRLLRPDEMARGMSPIDKTTYLPYYCGDFTPEGSMIDPSDPFLYWLIPINYRNGPQHPDEVDDFVEKHGEMRTTTKTSYK